MISTILAPASPSLREVRRRLLTALPEAAVRDDPAPLELTRTPDGVRPHVAGATTVEEGRLRCRDVPGERVPVFEGFLDGSQLSFVALYDRAVPLVLGSASAAVRVRHDRRMTTWKSDGSTRVYAPMSALSAATRERLAGLGELVRDTSEALSTEGSDEPVHPFAMTDAAVHALQRDREALETALAVDWCRTARGPLLVDGGIAGDATLARAIGAIGVVKSHHVIYGGPAAFAAISELRAGQRSSVMLIEPGHSRRSSVASWYLKLRDGGAGDPFWGLVRVEIAPAERRGADGDGITRRADDVSRWILAETLPLALPDARWDRMSYGVRDCEEFLRAIRS